MPSIFPLCAQPTNQRRISWVGSQNNFANWKRIVHQWLPATWHNPYHRLMIMVPCDPHTCGGLATICVLLWVATKNLESASEWVPPILCIKHTSRMPLLMLELANFLYLKTKQKFPSIYQGYILKHILPPLRPGMFHFSSGLLGFWKVLIKFRSF